MNKTKKQKSKKQKETLPDGLEPSTLRLTAARSNQLSYGRPVFHLTFSYTSLLSQTILTITLESYYGIGRTAVAHTTTSQQPRKEKRLSPFSSALSDLNVVHKAPHHTLLIVMLLLTRVTLLVLHSVNLSGDILQFISQVIYIICKVKRMITTTGSHVFSSRRFVDRLELISYLIPEGNTCFLRTASGKAHCYSILAFKVVTKIIAWLPLRLVHFCFVFISNLQH